MSARQQDLVKIVEYPETDGEPMAETDFHLKVIFNLRFALQNFFLAEEQVYVGSNLLLYYVEGDPTKCVAPDVFVVRGVGRHDRRVYKLWEEQQAPCVVIEVASRKTIDNDLQWKRQLYAWLGVNEYFLFDPEYDLQPAFRAFKLHGKSYGETAITNGRVLSEELGLDLVNTGETLRLCDPQTGKFLATPAEEAAARRKAEAERERLAAKLRELGIDPDSV